MIRKILKMGDPRLLQVARPVEDIHDFALKPMETVEQFPFVLCAWPSFADQPYITNYRIYDDRVGETTRFTYRPDHEWYWIPHQKPTEVSMLKCYDSVTDGLVSRWSFHTACIDPTAPANARCRKNVVVRSFVFF